MKLNLCYYLLTQIVQKCTFIHHTPIKARNKNMQQQFNIGRERKLDLKWNKQTWCQNFVFFQKFIF